MRSRRRRPRQYRAPKFLPLWALIGGVIVVALIGSYPYYSSNAYVLSLLGKFLCFGLFALSIDLIWGFTGILSLGQAVYFGIGAYFVALSLKINLRHGPSDPLWRQISRFHGMERPDRAAAFHDAARQHAVRGHLSRSVVPTLLALLFGVITFKRHIYGVYCAVITLAESLILQDAIIEYQAYTGGFNGITDYSNYATPAFLWFILAVCVRVFPGCRGR